MSNPNRRGPRALSDILGELFTVRGYSRLRALGALEEAWNIAVGEPHCRQTRVGELRRGVLSVTVAHPALLEELAAFRKPELWTALRAGAPDMAICDIRFRVGPVELPPPVALVDAPSSGKEIVPPERSRSAVNSTSGRSKRPGAGHHDRKRSTGER
jgi:hypothetical protein